MRLVFALVVALWILGTVWLLLRVSSHSVDKAQALPSIFDSDSRLVVLDVEQASELGLDSRTVVNSGIDERFTCANMSLLAFDSPEPFRKGRRRAVWLARWFSGTQLRRYVVKRPLVRLRPDGEPDAAQWRADVRALADEYATMQSFDTWHVVLPFGGCFDVDVVGSPTVGLVTEFFEHYTLSEMLYLPAPWCVRSRVALGFVLTARHLANSTRRGDGVLCDWSLTNFVVRRKDYRLVAVDLSSWNALKHRRDGTAIPLLAGDKCEPDDATSCQKMGCEFNVLSGDQQLRSPPDATCDATTRRCVGFDDRSHAWVLGSALLRVLAKGIEQGAGDSVVNDDFWLVTLTGDVEFQNTLLDICDQLSVSEKRKRLKLSSAENRLRSLMSRFNAAECLVRWQWHNRRH
jgi:hypothetical protein